MATKYYGGVQLPELNVDFATYPHVIIGEYNSDGSYMAFCLTTSTYLIYYPQVYPNCLVSNDACTGIIYRLENAESEWVLQDEILNLTGSSQTLLSTTTFNFFFSTLGVVNLSTYSYMIPASVPVDFMWDWSDIEGRVKAIGDLPDGLEIYKISDELYTYEQLLTMSGSVTMNIAGVGPYGAPFGPEDIDVTFKPGIMMAMICIIPYPNCEIITDGIPILFPEAGIYAMRYPIDGVEILGGSTSFSFPTADPTWLFFGDIETSVDFGDAWVSAETYKFEVALQERDVVISSLIDMQANESVVNVDEVAETLVQDENTFIPIQQFGAPFNWDTFQADFSTKPFTGLQASVNSEDNTSFVSFVTPEPIQKLLVAMRYIPRSANKIQREVVLNCPSSNIIQIRPGETYQIQIVSDNAIEDAPTYSYYRSTSYENYYSVDDTGLITAVSVGVGTVVVESPETENYFSFYKSIAVQVTENPDEGGREEPEQPVEKQNRQLSATLENSNLNINDTTNIIITDNAASDSPTYSYSVSSGSSVSVDNSGVVTVIGYGKSIIAISAEETENYKAGVTSVSITIEAPESGGDSIQKTARNISVRVSNSNPIIGDTTQLTITDNASGDSPTYTYSVSGNSVRVDNLGVVTTVATGSSTITINAAETANYEAGTATVTINVKPKNSRTLTASVASDAVILGSTSQITITDNASNDSPTYSYESGDVSIVTVDNSGLITAVGKGTAMITIRSGETSHYLGSTTTLQVTVVSPTLSNIPNDYTIEFINPNWKNLYPNNYSVVDGTTPFYVDSTFIHEGHNTLRSGSIGNNGTSTSTIHFTLLQKGSIEFNYKVSSENNYDWLTITLDGTQVVRVAGTVDWTVFTKELDTGTHSLELKYTKDGSNGTGSDAGAIGYIRIIGMETPFAKKYLVRSGDMFYTIVNEVLTSLDIQELNASAFLTYGRDELPTWQQISSLVNPEILYWYDSNDYVPTLSLTMDATPPAQTLVTCSIDLSDPTITGVEFVTTEFEGEPLYACSFDGGETWYIHNGTEWALLTDLSTGMYAENLMAITTDQWTEKVASVESFMFRFVLNTINDKVTNIVVDYTN